MNRLIQYIIEAKDATSDGIHSAINRVKTFGTTVASRMTKAKKDLDTTEVKEKFIHTERVLDRLGRALDRVGIEGEQFNDCYDTMKKRLDDFNKSGQNFDALCEHMKMSMRDLGISENNVANGVKMLKEELVGAKEKAAEFGADGLGKFNALRTATAALHGNFGQVAVQLTKLIPAFRNMGAAGVAAAGVIGAAVMSIFKLLGALKDLFTTVFNLDAMPKDLSKASGEIEKMKNASEQFYWQMEESRKTSQTMAKQFEDSANAINKMTKAQNEFNRAQELAKAKTKEEKEAINAKYDALNRQADSKKEGDILAKRRETLADERDRLLLELGQAKKDQAYFLKQQRVNTSKARENLQGGFGSVMSTLGHYVTLGAVRKGNTVADAALSLSTNASNAYDDALEREDEIRKKIQENAAALEVLDTEIKASKLNVKTADQKAKNEASEKAQEREKKLADFRKANEESLAKVQAEREKAAYEASKDTSSKALADRVKMLDDYYGKLKKARNKEEADALASAKDIMEKKLELRRTQEKDAKKAAEDQRKFELDKATTLEKIKVEREKAVYEASRNTDSKALADKVKLLDSYYEAVSKASTKEQADELARAQEMSKKRIELARQEERDKEREAKRAAKELAKFNKDAAKATLKEQVAIARKELAASKELGSDAQGKLRDAQNKVKEAWGFYKDKNAMQSYRDEAEKEIAAKKQWEKDAKKLESGGLANKYDIAKDLNRAGKTDELEEMFAKWRKGSFGLSLEQEATMRVGLAKDEEQQAKKSLEGIQKNTEHLKSILEILKSGGEAE